MKTSKFIFAALFAGVCLFSCNTMEQGRTGEFSVPASKSDLTKALILEGSTLKASWSSGETVGVYRPGNFSNKLGTLSPTSFGSSGTVLSGNIDLTGLKLDDELFLLYPDSDWSYYGQDGTFASVSSSFDYATATVTVQSISGGHVSASDASFQNRQAIVTFKLKDKDAGKTPLAVSDFTLFSGTRNLIDSYDQTFSPVSADNFSLKLSPDDPVSELTLAVPTISADPAGYRFYATVFDSSWNKTLYETIADGASFVPGKYYAGNLNMYAVRYTAAGSPASVFTSAWDASQTANDLEFNGSYFMQNLNVPGPCEISLKVVKSTKDGSVFIPDGGDSTNITVTAYAAGSLTVIYNPADDSVSAEMHYSSELYFLYVLDEKVATGADWGSVRTIWYGGLTEDIPSSGTETIGSYTYNRFVLTDAVVGSTVDIYYKGDNGCEVKLPAVAVASATKKYFFRTDGVQQTAVSDPANPAALDATPRFWLRSSVTDLHCHMWGGDYGTNWPGDAATMVDAKQYGHNWYYVNIIPGTAHMIFNSPSGGWQTADLDLADPACSYYYYIYGGDNLQTVTW